MQGIKKNCQTLNFDLDGTAGWLLHVIPVGNISFTDFTKSHVSYLLIPHGLSG